MIDSNDRGPINLGNPVERRVDELAQIVLEITGSDSEIEFHPLPTDDPTRRKPDITRAQTRLGWQPQVETSDGLRRTLDWFLSNRQQVSDAAEAIAGEQFGGQESPSVLEHA